MNWFSRFLFAFRRRRVWAWVALLAYACAVTFPHQPVQVALGHFTDRFGREPLYQSSVAIALTLAAIVNLLFFKRISGQTGRVQLTVYWLASYVLMAGIWRIFMANNTELVHFYQYFPEGVALLAITLSAMESMAWLTLLAVADELFQFITLTKGRDTLLDFNDIYMDLIGGTAGILFAMVTLRCEWRTAEPLLSFVGKTVRRPGIIALLTMVIAVAALLVSGQILVYESAAAPHWFAFSRLKTDSFWYFSPLILGPHHFHELMPPEGALLVLLTIPLIAPLERKLRVR